MALPLRQPDAAGKFFKQMGQGLEMMNSINTVSQNPNRNAILAAEAKYAPYNQYASALSKQAYANMLPYQIQATLLSNPNIWRNMSPQDAQKLSGVFAGMGEAIPGAAANGVNSIPHPNAPNTSSPTGNNLLKMLMSKLGLGGADSMTQSGAPPNAMPGTMQQNQNPVAATLGSDMATAPPPANGLINSMGNTMPLPQGNPAINTMQPPPMQQPNGQPTNNGFQVPNSTIGSIADQVNSNGAPGAINPLDVNAAQAEGLKAGATSEAKSNTAEWKELQDEAFSSAKDSVLFLGYLDKLYDEYNKIPEWNKGILGGHLPAWSGKAQEFETDAKNVIKIDRKLNQSGHMNLADTALSEDSKLKRSLKEDSFNNLYESQAAIQTRSTEFPEFLQLAKVKGFTPSEAKVAWIKYNIDKPVINVDGTVTLDNEGKGYQYLQSPGQNINFSKKELDKINIPEDKKFIEKQLGIGDKKEKMMVINSSDYKKLSPASKNLAKTMELPEFNSKEEFNEWYDSQDQIVQKAVKERLRS